MKRLLKAAVKLLIIPLLGLSVLSSCSLQPDEEILDDINSEINDKTTDENEEKKS